MKKRVISLVLATVFATTMLAGCGIENKPEAGTPSTNTADTNDEEDRTLPKLIHPVSIRQLTALSSLIT